MDTEVGCQGNPTDGEVAAEPGVDVECNEQERMSTLLRGDGALRLHWQLLVQESSPYRLS